MTSWMSLLGLYRMDNDLFNEFVVPTQVVKADLIVNLLAETAELEVIYPDPEIMRQIIGAWSRARLNVWERIALVLTTPYDPFINITRDETRTIQTYNTNTQSQDVTRTDNTTQAEDFTRTDDWCSLPRQISYHHGTSRSFRNNQALQPQSFQTPFH